MNYQYRLFIDHVRNVAASDTSADSEGWLTSNPLWGHCAIVTLIAQDTFGGEIVRGSLKDYSKYAHLKYHYWNRINGEDIDFTQEQYPDLSYKDLAGEIRERERVLEHPNTSSRYTLLKERFAILRDMKTAIILHGMPDKEDYYNPNQDAESNCHWLPWIQRQLIIQGVLAQTPEMPEPYTPNYKKWNEVLGQFKVDENTDLIGHSCGAGFLLRWLSENKQKVGKLVLVAPWIDPTNELEEDNDFFDFEIDSKLLERTEGIYILNSSNDDIAIHKSVEEIIKKLPNTKLIEIKNKGHFTLSGMGTREFPELANILLK